VGVARSASATPTATSPPHSSNASSVLGSPKPHAKFDPKAVIKKATHGAASKSALGLDVSLPTAAQKSATTNQFHANSAANNHKAVSAIHQPGTFYNDKHPTHTDMYPATNGSKLAGKVSGFGLGAGQGTDQSSKVAMDLEDEKESKRKLEKLELPISEDQDDDAALANGEQDDDEDSSVADEDDHEAALKALAARRAEAEGAIPAIEQDVTMEDAQPAAELPPAEDQKMTDAPTAEPEEELDPLDAFMDGLQTDSAPKMPTFRS